MSRLLVTALLGGLVLAGPTFYVTRAVYQRQALEERAEKVQAQKEMSDLKTALAAARINLLNVNSQLSKLLLEERDEERSKLDFVAAGLLDVSRRVSLCANKSDVRVTVTPTGTIEAIPGEQFRSLEAVVRDFATACAINRDADAIDHNKLVDWVERLPEEVRKINEK